MSLLAVRLNEAEEKQQLEGMPLAACKQAVFIQRSGKESSPGYTESLGSRKVQNQKPIHVGYS